MPNSGSERYLQKDAKVWKNPTKIRTYLPSTRTTISQYHQFQYYIYYSTHFHLEAYVAPLWMNPLADSLVRFYCIWGSLCINTPAPSEHSAIHYMQVNYIKNLYTKTTYVSVYRYQFPHSGTGLTLLYEKYLYFTMWYT